MKHITRVEYIYLSDGIEISEEKTLGESYRNEFTFKDRIVNSIVDKFENNVYSVLICFNNGEEEEVFKINRIFRDLTTV